MRTPGTGRTVGPVLDSRGTMRPLAAVERFLERLFERPTTRIFRPAVQPIQVQRRIERTMELARTSRDGRVSVPASFVVRLHPTDLPPDQAAAAALAADLADAALRFARDHRYHVPDRPTVALLADAAVRRGEVQVVAEGGPDAEAGPTRASPERAPSDPGAGTSIDGERAADDGTARYTAPRARIPATVLRTVTPDGRERRHAIARPVVTIGRAPDNDVVIDDGRVSRHHARLVARGGGLVYTDLDSSNGSVVGGVRVREVALGEGDRIELGRSVVIVESVAGDAG